MHENIAVIGSGMAGLAAARLCHDGGHRVTVFEAQTARGMDAHALTLHGGVVDVPLRVMSPAAWSSVLALAQHVGVQTFAVDTFASCRWLDGDTWFRSGRVPLTGWPAVGSWRYLNAQAWRIARGFLHLRRALRRLENENNAGILLGELAEREGFDPLFWRGLVLPLLTTICTCREAHLRAWPALPLLRLLDTIVHGATLRRLTGGTSALVNGLARDLHFCSGSAIESVAALEAGVFVRNTRGESGVFDRVIVATQANQVDFLDSVQFARERELLQAIRFDHGELWVHGDTRFLPQRRADWSALNYTVQPDLQQAMFTVLVNAVEPTLRHAPADAPPVMQTWNPLFEPEAATVIARVPLARAVVHSATAAAQTSLADLHAEAGRRVFFCGSWAYPGVPLLESAVRSAVAVAEKLRVPAPWLTPSATAYSSPFATHPAQ